MLASLVTAAAIFSAPVPAMNYDWFSPVYDWPAGMKKDELVDVEVDNTINPYGYIEGCTAHVYIGNPGMGPYLCARLRQRGEFDAARDPNGHRLYGIFRAFVVLMNTNQPVTDPPKNIRWTDFDIQVPATPDLEKQKFITIQFAVDTNGTPSSCSLVPVVGYGLEKKPQTVDPAVVAQACAALPVNMHPEPARNRSGAVVPSVQTAEVGLIPTR
jgi:hypothetical protein